MSSSSSRIDALLKLANSRDLTDAEQSEYEQLLEICSNASESGDSDENDFSETDTVDDAVADTVDDTVAESVSVIRPWMREASIDTVDAPVTRSRAPLLPADDDSGSEIDDNDSDFGDGPPLFDMAQLDDAMNAMELS